MTYNIPYQDSLRKWHVGVPDMCLTVHAIVGKNCETKHEIIVSFQRVIVLYGPFNMSHDNGVE